MKKTAMILALALGMSALNTMAQESDRPLKRGEGASSQDETKMDRPALRGERLHAQREPEVGPQRPRAERGLAQADVCPRCGRAFDAATPAGRGQGFGPRAVLNDNPRLRDGSVPQRRAGRTSDLAPQGRGRSQGPASLRDDGDSLPPRDSAGPQRRGLSANEDRLDQDGPAPRHERSNSARRPLPESDDR